MAKKKKTLPANFYELIEAKDITLIGGNAEEAPMAYKNIETVMASQSDLVDILGTFQPRIVRMDK